MLIKQKYIKVIFWTLALAVMVLALMPLIPLLLHKQQERSLLLTNEGIETTIGKKNGKIPWSKIRILVKNSRVPLKVTNVPLKVTDH